MVQRSTISADPARAARYRLAGFEVDLSLLELRTTEGERVDISPLAFDLLVYLIEHRDRVVPKDELFENLWGDVAVTASSLVQGIWAVRRALRDTGGEQHVIKNVRGRGYRLVADVEPLLGKPSETPAAPGPRLSPVPALPRESGMVGRAAELLQLRRALDEAVHGHGRIALLCGWPGMGKTHMAQELARLARAAGLRVCEGRCLQDESMPPFWPLQQIARSLLRQHPQAELGSLIGDGAGDLVKLIPELRECLPDLASAPPRELDRDRFQLFDALRALLERAAQHTPMVLLLDDLHWADESTLRVLDFLAPTLEKMRVLLLCTLRQTPGAGAAKSPLELAASNLLRQPGAMLIELAGLPDNEVETLLRAHALGPVDAQLVRRVFDLTGGNPLFITSLARWLTAHGERVAKTGADVIKLPQETRVVLRQIVAALPGPCQQLLQLCAVFGQTFHIADLRRAADLPAQRVLDLLEPALENRIVRADSENVSAFHFGHPTIRETLYEDLPRSERVRLHQKAAESIARAHADDPTPRLTELAHHYYEAAAGGSAIEATRYCRLAAERGYEATAFEEAVVYYRRALYALDLTDAEDDRTRCELLLGLGRSMRGTRATPDEIRAVFARAFELGKRLGDAHLQSAAATCHAGRGPMRVGVLRDIGTVDPTEIALLEQALESLPDEASADRALVEAWLAYSLYNSERRDQRKALARSAVERARRIGDGAVLAECLMLQQASVRGPAELDARIEILGEIIALTRQREPEALGLQLDAHQERAWSYWERGDLARAEADMETVQRLAEQMRQPREKRCVVVWRAMRADAEGCFERAEPLLAELERAFPLPPGRVDQGRAIRDFNLLALRGRGHEAIPGLEAYAEKYPLPVAWRCGLISTYTMAGRNADAQRELDRIAAFEFAAIPDDHNWVTSHTRLAWAAYELKDAGHCAVLYRKLEPYAERMCVIGIHGFCGGVVHKALGELATVMRDFARAERHLLRAIEANLRLGARLWSELSRLSYAEMLLARRESGDLARALQEIAQAEAFGRSHAIEIFAEHCDRARRIAAALEG